MGVKGGFIRIQFFECIKIGLTLPRNLEVILQFFPKTFSTSQIWKKKKHNIFIHWATTHHLRDELVFGDDAAVSNDIKLQTTKPGFESRALKAPAIRNRKQLRNETICFSSEI